MGGRRAHYATTNRSRDFARSREEGDWTEGTNIKFQQSETNRKMLNKKAKIEKEYLMSLLLWIAFAIIALLAIGFLVYKLTG